MYATSWNGYIEGITYAALTVSVIEEVEIKMKT
jgi:hypothetical protein